MGASRLRRKSWMRPRTSFARRLACLMSLMISRTSPEGVSPESNSASAASALLMIAAEGCLSS